MYSSLNIIRILSLVSLFLIFPANSAGQDFKETRIKILENSQINIQGDAGIANFTCEFDTNYLQSPEKILYRTENSSIVFSDAELILENRGFDCGNKSRNEDFHEMVRTEEHPQMKIKLNEVTQRNENEVKANVDIWIAGKENTYTIPVEIIEGSALQIKGQFKINVRDFGLEPITKMFGLIKVDEVIDINMDLIIRSEN